MQPARNWIDGLPAGHQRGDRLDEETPGGLGPGAASCRAQLHLCAPVEGELWFGVAKSARPQENRLRLLNLLQWLPSLPFAGEATRCVGEIRALLARQGTPIGPYDLQIAAIAQAHSLILVTDNTIEFSRVPGLRIENWQRMPDSSNCMP